MMKESDKNNEQLCSNSKHPQPARTSEQIKTEIEKTIGFFPPFFAPAVDTPQVLENLWQQTLSAYINNPIQAAFIEKLLAYLSRFCSVPYCIVCHSCALHPLGMTAGDVLELLEQPAPMVESDIEKQFNVLIAEPGPLSDWPMPDSLLEESLLRCSIFIFLNPTRARTYRKEINRLLGDVNYSHWTILLSFIKTCHIWVEAHPELSYETDQRVKTNLDSLIREEPRLADFFRDYRKRVRHEEQRQMFAESETAKLSQNLVDAWIQSFSWGMSSLGDIGGKTALFEAGRKFYEYVKKNEKIDLLGKEPLDTMNKIYKYFVDNGFFKGAYAKKEDDVYTLFEKGSAGFKGTADAFMSGCPTPASPCYIVIRTLLAVEHGVDFTYPPLHTNFNLEEQEWLIKFKLLKYKP